MNNILTTKNLSKNWGGVKAVDELSINISKDKITGIVGPNGSGKTTMINLLSGLFPPSSGQIIISDTLRHTVNPDENGIYGLTRTFQQVRIFEQMTVLDNILVILTDRAPFSSLFEKHSDLHLAKAEDILKKVGLSEKKHTMGEDLSYGQRKLLEVARVIAMDTEIILLDEPFAGLFPEMVKKIASFVKEWKHEGKTVVLVEHNMSLIRELCDHLIVMDAGKLLAEGTPEEVLSRKDVVEAYLGE